MTRVRIGECAYCGAEGELTSDHVPPECLFAPPRPPGLIKVPSCFRCNNGASADDEYFRLMLTIRHDVAKHPDVSALLPTVHRSLGKPRKRKLLNAVYASIRHVSVHSPAGLYLGRVGAYDVDLVRLDRVVTRIVKGLVYHHHSQRLPSSYDVRSFSEDGLRDLDLTTRRELTDGILKPLYCQVPFTVGSRVFEYRYASTNADPMVSAWLLVFYERVRFLSLIAPRDAA